MSMHPQASGPIPEETARVARAAFPRGNPYLTLRDQLGSLYDDQDFAALFSQRGRPAQAPWQLALVCVFQFMEGLSDRQAAEAVRSRIAWKDALGLDLADPGFDYSVLSKFRARLLAGSAEMLLLDRMLERFKAQGLLKARGKQRTDSTHVLAAIRPLNRLERVGQTLRAALNTIATVAPEWLRQQAAPEGFDRYSTRIEEWRLPKGQEAREQYAELIGADGSHLLSAIYEPSTPAHLRELPAGQICSVRSLCTKAAEAPGHLTLRPQAEHELLQHIREIQTTAAWKRRYERRARIEGTISQGTRAFGLRRSRSIGEASTHLQHLLTAGAINLIRFAKWKADVPHAKTRTSRFAALKAS